MKQKLFLDDVKKLKNKIIEYSIYSSININKYR